MAEQVHLRDVSMRDGLQDEPAIVATADKAAIARALVEAGVSDIEATSFVHPKWVPQLADAEALVPTLPRGPQYTALIMNVRGIERGIAAFEAAGFARGSYRLGFTASASPRHNRANNNRSIDETMEIFDAVSAIARREGVALHGGIACSFVSPWPDETIDSDTVAMMAKRYADGGCTQVSLADTVGRADPRTVGRRVDDIRAAVSIPLSLHVHDSFGYALANVYAGLERGVRRFDGALAGLGGCPWAPGAQGNLDLEKLNEFLIACGCETGLSSDGLTRAAVTIRAGLANAEPVEREHAAIQ